MTKSGKHCGKRRNCTFCAISSFVTMFSISRLLQRHPKAFIWGKGLISAWLNFFQHTNFLWRLCSRRLLKPWRNRRNCSSWAIRHNVFNHQSYHGGQFTYLCVSWRSHTSSPHNRLSKQNNFIISFFSDLVHL